MSYRNAQLHGMRCALGTLNGSGRRGPRNWARFGRKRANPFGDGVRIEKADLQTAVFRCAEYPEMAEAVSKVWIEKSDGEHSRLLLLFTTIPVAANESTYGANSAAFPTVISFILTFDTAWAVSRRSGDEVHLWSPNGGFRQIRHSMRGLQPMASSSRSGH